MLRTFLQDPENPGGKLTPLLDYSILQTAPQTTRLSSAAPCPCTVCSLAKMDLSSYSKFIKEHSNKVGRPLDKQSIEPPKKIVLCDSCFSELAPGKPHVCQKSVKRNNIVSLIRSTSVASQSAVMASSLKTLAEDIGESSRGGTLHLQSGSKQLEVIVGQSRKRPQAVQFSHENLRRLGTKLNLSNNSIM